MEPRLEPWFIPCTLYESNNTISPKETEGNTDGNTDGYTDWDFTGGSPSTADTPEHTPSDTACVKQLTCRTLVPRLEAWLEEKA